MTSRLRRGVALLGGLFSAVGIAGFAGLLPVAPLSALLALLGGVVMLHRTVLVNDPQRIPVVMLHSVVGFRPERPKNFSIWCAPRQFEGYLKYLRWRGYTTITLHELHAHLAEGAPLPARAIVLTFDDGYLDNWVYVAPLLRKYGFSGTVFMPTDFIQPGETPRASLEDVWAGRLREEELSCYGYLNRAELRRLAEEGVLDIQSHGQSHTWLPCSGRVLRFHHPGVGLRDLRWMWWNRHPERKPFWFEELSPEGVPWGAPVYESRLALAGPAAIPDPRLEELLINEVETSGGRRMFDTSDWEARLRRVVDEHPSLAPQVEDAASFRARLSGELTRSREIIEEITGRPVRFMCWPNGGTCSEAFEALDSCGYLAATLPSRMKQPRNFHGTDAARIGRVSASSFFRGSRRVWPWVLSFALKIERNRGNGYMELPIKAIWLYRRFVKPSGATPPGVGS